MSDLDARVQKSLREVHDRLAQRGELLALERLEASYSAFRSRFGPDALRSLDGISLLNAMHTHGNKESLVIWLEFKDDDEFPGRRLGSIAGGSAHKLGLFRRKGTTQWVTGSPKNEKNISDIEAVDLARKHRDQLLRGVSLLEALPNGSDDSTYFALQAALERQAPDICGLAWAHKYWSLLFPDKLDDYHNERWQRYNLLRLLEVPPPPTGLYVCAGRYVRLAAEMGWPMNNLTAVLNERHGQPLRYWLVETRTGQKGESFWSLMHSGEYAAIGWPKIGDLSSIVSGKKVAEAVRVRLQSHYSTDPKTLSRQAAEVRDFIARVQNGDVILAADGNAVLGIGHVTGPYRYEASEPVEVPHRHAVKWITTDAWKLPMQDGSRSAFSPVDRHPENIIAIEQRLLDGAKRPAQPVTASASTRSRVLEGTSGRIQTILERKGQVIIYGPPGTGKTHWARKTALDLAAIGAFGRPFGELAASERAQVEGTAREAGLVRWCTFHPAYGYEDFIEGFRPQLNVDKQVIFEQVSGIFKTLCGDAKSDSGGRQYFIVIDEINRGDIPRIFGELLTLLEKDKREMGVTLPLSGEKFFVPRNVHVIGTMNTADRSIALLDIALRRRFGFVELMPDVSVLGAAAAGGSIPLGLWLTALNERLRANLGRDARNLQIGHAYLLENGEPVTNLSRFVEILAEDIVPLLEEYCYEEYGALSRILGAGLVDQGGQRVRHELFNPGKAAELIQALIEPAPDIVTASAASDEGDDAEDVSDAQESEA